jgi:hypothetical protein
MAAGKKTARREWTRSDIRELKSMTKTVLARQIARRLRRSEGAVRQKAFVLGTSLTVRTTPPWQLISNLCRAKIGGSAPPRPRKDRASR